MSMGRDDVRNKLNFAAAQLLAAAAQSAAYAGWSDSFSREEVRSAWTLAAWNPRKLTIADLRLLTADDLESYGFRRWEGNHWVVPLWAWNMIANGEELLSINNEQVIHGDELSLDTRFGCVAYGFVLEEEKG